MGVSNEEVACGAGAAIAVPVRQCGVHKGIYTKGRHSYSITH